MITQFKNTKLWINQKKFEVSLETGYSGTEYYVYRKIGTVEIGRVRSRSIPNHIEKVIVRDDLLQVRVRRENNIGQAINGKGTVVKQERQNQVTAKVKRSMVHNYDGNLVRNGG
tara:strand:+ start:855 stop:1196 length:342 start_codon:yes stop_codon:yes gene_type:complete